MKYACGRKAVRSESMHAPARSRQEWQAQLRDYLVKTGLKHSDQRAKIAELILQGGTAGVHLDAQGIVELVKKKHPEIGAATVYRNIKVLCDALILKESLTDTQGRVVYELYDDEHHDHVVCLDCGEIFEFHNAKIESLQDGLVKEMEFTPLRHRHVIYAHCDYQKS
jgi:Fur family ferric uptake transcriptional regulator